MNAAGGLTHLLRYAVGSGRLFAGDRLLVLVSADVSSSVVDELWAAVRAGEATRAAGILLGAAVEDAVVLAPAERGGRVLLRGRAVLVEPWSESGAGTIAFREVEVPRGRVVARLDDDTAVCDLPLDAGVVGAGAFDWVAVDSAAPPHGSPPEPETAAGNAGEPHEAQALQPAAHEQIDASAAEEPALDPTRTLSSEELHDMDASAGPSTLGIGGAEEDPVPPDLTADSYDRLFGATSLFMPPQPIQPGPQSSEPPVNLAAPVVSMEPGTIPATSEEPGGTPPSTVAVEQSAVGGLIDGVPSFLLGTASASASASTSPDVEPPGTLPGAAPTVPAGAQPTTATPRLHDDVSELTVARPPKLGAAGPQTLIQAVHCPLGHLNPAESVTCRICGAEVPSQSSVTVPRPPLGALVGVDVPAGAPPIIELDRSLVLGRKPFVDEVTSSVPRLVVVDSPDGGISRQHAKVILDGWHVLVSDLESRYGTVVVLPGEEPLLLHPHSPVMITPGSLVTLAEVVTYRFQAQP